MNLDTTGDASTQGAPPEFEDSYLDMDIDTTGTSSTRNASTQGVSPQFENSSLEMDVDTTGTSLTGNTLTEGVSPDVTGTPCPQPGAAPNQAAGVDATGTSLTGNASSQQVSPDVVGTPCPQSGEAPNQAISSDLQTTQTIDPSLTGNASIQGVSPNVTGTPCPQSGSGEPQGIDQDIQDRLDRRSFDVVKRRFLRQQRQGKHVFVDPILRMFDQFETAAVAHLRAANDPSLRIDLFTFRIGALSLRDLVPLALYRDDSRSWFEDITVDFTVDHAARFGFCNDIAYIPTGFNDIFFKVNAPRAYTAQEIRAGFAAELAHLAQHGTLQHMTWPFPPSPFEISGVAMACNTGSHWYCIFLRYDRVLLQCTVEIYDSSPSETRLNDLREYLPSFACLMALCPAVNIPNLGDIEVNLYCPYQQRNSIDCGPITAFTLVNLMRQRHAPEKTGDTVEFCRKLRHESLGWAYERIMSAQMTETYAEEADVDSEDESDSGDDDPPEEPLSREKRVELEQRILKLEMQKTNYNMKLVDLVIGAIKAAAEGSHSLPILLDHILLYMPGEWYSETVIDASIQHAGSASRKDVLYIPAACTGTWLPAAYHERLENAFVQWNDTQIMHSQFRLVSKKGTIPADLESMVFAWCYSSHWFAVQAIHSDGSINVYDSYADSWPIKTFRKIKREAEHTLPMYMALASAQAGWKEVHWTVEFKESMLQDDNSSCGPITVENCLNLLDGAICRTGTVDRNDAISMRARHIEYVMRKLSTSDRTSFGPFASLLKDQKRTLTGYFLYDHNVNYLELICNALEDHADGLTLDEIVNDVRKQIAQYFELESDWSQDDAFIPRIMSYLDRKGSLSLGKNEDRWFIHSGVARNMSTKEKSRLASTKPTSVSTSLHDPIDNDYDLIIVFDRSSRYVDQTLSNLRPEDLIESWWRRFGPTNQMPDEYDGTQDLYSSPFPVWVRARLENWSSNESLLDMLKEDDLVVDALDKRSRRGGSRVLLLQANFDGTSNDPVSFRPALGAWPSLVWDMMIVVSLPHERASKVPEGLYRFALQDHAMDHSYSLHWFQASLSSLADLWEFGPTTNSDRDLDISHELILHMMVMSWYYKSDPDGTLSPTRIVPERQNYTIRIINSQRRTFELGKPVKECHTCLATSPVTRWTRGRPEVHQITNCQRLRLHCGNSACLPETSVEKTVLYEEVLDEMTQAYGPIPEYSNGKVREHIFAEEGRGQPLKPVKQWEGYACEPCGYYPQFSRDWVAHLLTKKHSTKRGTLSASYDHKYRSLPDSQKARIERCSLCQVHVRGEFKKHLETHHFQEISRRVKEILRRRRENPESSDT